MRNWKEKEKLKKWLERCISLHISMQLYGRNGLDHQGRYVLIRTCRSICVCEISLCQWLDAEFRITNSKADAHNNEHRPCSSKKLFFLGVNVLKLSDCFTQFVMSAVPCVFRKRGTDRQRNRHPVQWQPGRYG